MSEGHVGNPVRAILYDLDGVLVHSAPAWYRVIVRALAAWGKPPLSPDEFRRTFGQGIESDRASFFPDRTVAEIGALYDQLFEEEAATVDLAEGARELVGRARRRGLLQAVVTNAPRRTAQRILEAKELMHSLDAFVAAGDAAEKPAPDLLILALSRLGVAAECALYVGDTDADVRAARAAGVRMVGIGIDADVRVSSLRHVESLLASDG